MKRKNFLCKKWHDSEFLVWNSFDAKIYEPKKRRPLITSLRRGEAIKMRKEIIEEKEYKNV